MLVNRILHSLGCNNIITVKGKSLTCEDQFHELYKVLGRCMNYAGKEFGRAQQASVNSLQLKSIKKINIYISLFSPCSNIYNFLRSHYLSCYSLIMYPVLTFSPCIATFILTLYTLYLCTKNEGHKDEPKRLHMKYMYTVNSCINDPSDYIGLVAHRRMI